MDKKQIEIDAEAIYEAFKTGGNKAAVDKYNEIVDEKNLVRWVALALQRQAGDLIRAHKGEII